MPVEAPSMYGETSSVASTVLEACPVPLPSTTGDSGEDRKAHGISHLPTRVDDARRSAVHVRREPLCGGDHTGDVAGADAHAKGDQGGGLIANAARRPCASYSLLFLVHILAVSGRLQGDAACCSSR